VGGKNWFCIYNNSFKLFFVQNIMVAGFLDYHDQQTLQQQQTVFQQQHQQFQQWQQREQQWGQSGIPTQMQPEYNQFYHNLAQEL
jgi:hypothetical protein